MEGGRSGQRERRGKACAVVAFLDDAGTYQGLGDSGQRGAGRALSSGGHEAYGSEEGHLDDQLPGRGHPQEGGEQRVVSDMATAGRRRLSLAVAQRRRPLASIGELVMTRTTATPTMTDDTLGGMHDTALTAGHRRVKAANAIKLKDYPL